MNTIDHTPVIMHVIGQFARLVEIIETAEKQGDTLKWLPQSTA